MQYEILDYIRYYKTQQEEKSGQTIITFNAYEALNGNMVAPKLNRKNSKVKNITVQINQKDSPFPSIPYFKKHQEILIKEILKMENLHVQVGFSMLKELKVTLIKTFIKNLKEHYLFTMNMINQKGQKMNILYRFAKNVI